MGKEKKPMHNCNGKTQLIAILQKMERPTSTPIPSLERRNIGVETTSVSMGGVMRLKNMLWFEDCVKNASWEKITKTVGNLQPQRKLHPLSCRFLVPILLN